MSLFERPFIRRRALLILVLAALIFIMVAAFALINAIRPAGLASQAGPAAAPQILYLAPSEQPELWLASAAGQPPRQISHTNGGVYDYAASPDGAWIAFSARNEEGGYDLWEIQRQGETIHDPALILPCGTDWCISPAYDDGSQRIAYSRRRFSGITGSQPGAPRVWIFDRAGQHTDTLLIDPNVGGSSPAWSPDGRYLAFVDGLLPGLRVVDMETMDEFSLLTAGDSQFSWSPGSRSLLVTRAAAAHDHPYTLLVQVDVVSHQESLWMDDEELDTSVPVWSPAADQLAVARRVIDDGPGKQLWLLNPDGSPLQQLTDNPQANHAAYRWSPDGKWLIFQRLAFGSSSSLPEVMVWDSRDGSLTVLAEDAFQPAWIQ